MIKPAEHSLPLVHLEQTIRAVMRVIDESARGIALVVDRDNHLLGTITDGDIRRSILNDIPVDAPVDRLFELKSTGPQSFPVTVREGMTHKELAALMREKSVRQLPVLDESGKVVDLVTWNDLMPNDKLEVEAVVMAGGFGKRLHPLTEGTPKPMLPLGDRPIMHKIFEQLHQAGIRKAVVTTHFMKEKIEEYFGNGEKIGMDLRYINEDRPLGTAGALSFLNSNDSTLLVINGDILTNVDFHAMWEFHKAEKAELTVGVRQYDFAVPYGVIKTNGYDIESVEEKPHLKFFINAGIYLLEPAIREFIPNDRVFDMTDLIQCLVEAKRSVKSFPIIEYWLDIGSKSDYALAQQDMKQGKI